MKNLTPICSLIAFVGIAYFCQQNITTKTILTAADKNLYQAKKTPKQYDKPSEAAAWMSSMRQTPKGTTPAQMNLNYQADITAAKASKANQDLPALSFEEIGPGIFGGRIRGFVIHPEREGHLLAGGVFGGVWKSTDDGQGWTSNTDFLQNIAIGSLYLDPDNPERVFLGTGEGFFNFDAARGNGIFVSEDFGDSWTQLESTTGPDFYYVNRITRVPNTNTLIAATRTGIHRSTDLGQTWSEVSEQVTSGRGFTDLQSDPSDSSHVLAYHFGTANEAVVVDVDPADGLSGSNEAVPAAFGPDITTDGISGEIAVASSNGGVAVDGCSAIESDVNAKIAIMRRGNCNFTDKVKNAQDAGAVAAIIVQSENAAPFTMGGSDDSITIPSVMVERNFGESIIISTNTLQATLLISVLEDLQRFVMRSTDQGQSWDKLGADEGIPEIDIERIEIGFAADGKSYLAVSRETEELANNRTNGTRGLWQSTGSNNREYEKTNSSTNFVERQGWYDLAIAVNPSDSDHVVMGAVDQYVTNNGGSSISRVSFWFSPPGFIPQYIHADHHGYFFSPHNSEHIYAVSDGGVSKSEDGGQTYFALNNGLYISQTYGIAVSPDGQNVTSGTQDNGSQIYFGDQQAWIEWRGGDGGYSAWDQQQGNFIYGSNPNGAMFGTNSMQAPVPMELPDTDGARFIQPFVLDPNNGNRMLVGTDNVFFTNNARDLNNATWTDVSDSINGSGVSALAFSPHQSTVAFAGMSNSDTNGTNQIIRIDNLGSGNQVVDIAPPNSLGAARSVVTDIKVDLFDNSGNTIYATFGGYFSNRILRTTDGGNSWTSISNNLPNMPLFQVINDPDDADILYLGTELGLWVGTKSGTTYDWDQFDYGPALTRVVDLVWNNGELYVGTHGRGTYKASKNAIDVSLIKFIATNSSCDIDNFLDRGESGQLMVDLTNNSAKNFDQVNVTFNEPNFINFTDANQTISLPGFGSETIALPVSLSAQASCLSDLTVPVTVNAGGRSFDTEITITTAANENITLGTFSDGAESVDTELTSMLALGNDGWVRTSDSVNSGNSSWFTTNEGAFSDKSLVTPWLTFDAGGNVLQFAMSYDTEGDSSQYWDGLVLEMRFKDSDLWFDIGHLSTIPYDGQLSTNNTAQTQFAWSGTQLDWREVTVDLGTQYTGKTAQIRFRMVSDTNTAQEGFWLDDISVSRVYTDASPSCDTCISDNNSVIPNRGIWFDPARDGHGFIIESFGANNLFFSMFYTYDDSGDPEWYTSLTTLDGGVLNPDFLAGTINSFSYNFDVDPAVVDPSVLDEDFEGRLMINFNNADIRNHPACQDGTQRNLDFSALATWRINDEEQTWCIEPIIADEARPEPDFGTNWWAGIDDNGWGYSLAQTGDVMVAFIFYFDAMGNPRWSTGTNNGYQANEPITVPMSDVFGYGRTQPLIERTFTPSGNLTLNLFNQLRDLDTDGTTSVDITYQGVEGGRWLRDDIKIQILSQGH